MPERMPRRALLVRATALTRRALPAGVAALALTRATPAAARSREQGDALSALVRAELEATYVYRTNPLGGLGAALGSRPPRWPSSTRAGTPRCARPPPTSRR
jgi:hypothetical protein